MPLNVVAMCGRKCLQWHRAVDDTHRVLSRTVFAGLLVVGHTSGCSARRVFVTPTSDRILLEAFSAIGKFLHKARVLSHRFAGINGTPVSSVYSFAGRV